MFVHRNVYNVKETHANHINYAASGVPMPLKSTKVINIDLLYLLSIHTYIVCIQSTLHTNICMIKM